MTLVGPSITVACTTESCDQNGIEKTVRATVLDVRTRLIAWPYSVTCGSCLREVKQITTGEAP